MKTLADYEYYRTELGVLYCGDCLEILPLIPDNSVDYMFTSPPYNRKRNDKYQEYTDIIEDYLTFLLNFTIQGERISKRNVFINIAKNYYNQIELLTFLNVKKNEIREIIIWEKENPMPNGGLNITSAYEFFICLGKLKLDVLKTYTKNIFKTSVCSSMPDEHKAVMNIKAGEYIYNNFMHKTSVIDPFMGTGTTAVLSEKNNMQWIGIEISKKYCEIAKKRISEEANQMKLFK